MGGNSWQQPVAGEPSLGTMHPHYAVLINNAAPGAGGYYDVDASSLPAGATAVYVRIQAAGAAIQAFTDNTPTPAFAPVATGAGGYGTGIVKLTSTRHFVYWVAAATAGVYVFMFYYWA